MSDRERQLLKALEKLLAVVDKTCEEYERDCPGAAECGYWNDEDKAAYDRAKELVAANRTETKVVRGITYYLVNIDGRSVWVTIPENES